MKRKEEQMESPKKEEIAEDWCFVCKEGGLLMVCEYKRCLKAYHPHCVEKSESDLEAGNYWTCNLHICMVCRRSPDVCCLCCPKAVCWQCMKDEQFVHIREGKGFCSECLRLSLMIEEKVDVDSDGEHVDFYDINTWEGLYKEYWDIINKQEGLTLETLHAADARMKKGNKKTDGDEKKKSKQKNDKRYGSDLEELDGCEENEFTSDTDCSDYTVKRKSKHKMRRSTKQTSAVKRNVKRKEFIGWGSKALIQFLQSINVNVSEKLSQDYVSSIINRYIKEKNLFHPVKKRKVVSDESLQSLFGRKMFNKHKIHDFLDAHFTENQEPLEDEIGYDSEDKNDIFPAFKRQRKMGAIISKKEVKYNVTQYHYASVVQGNIDLVYLRRSFVQKLSQEEEPDTFDNKVIGSIVKVKSDPNDYLLREPTKLMQVTGTTWNSDDGNNKKVLLKVSGLTEDIGINYLSECDITKASQLPLKLTGSQNFATWMAQVSTLMYGHDIYSYLDGSFAAPPKMIRENDKDVVNPVYCLWFRQDQLIQNALMSPVDVSIASQVATAATSKIAWDSLHTSFSNQSHTRIFSLRDMLGKVSKESKSVAEYLREIRSIVDELATAGLPISNEELLSKYSAAWVLNIERSQQPFEECEELKQCVKGGHLKQPTVAELKEKAALLHEGRIKHWMDRELKLLQHRIDLANEKGWRQQLYEHLAKKEKLLSSREHLLQNVPDVVPADMTELDYMSEDVKAEISVKSVPGNQNTSGPRGKKHQFYKSEEHTNIILKSKAYQYGPSPCWISPSQSIKVEHETEKSPEVLDSSGVEKDNKKNAGTQTD